MKIKFKSEEWDTVEKRIYSKEQCIPIEEVKSVEWADESMYVLLKSGEDLCVYSGSSIDFID